MSSLIVQFPFGFEVPAFGFVIEAHYVGMHCERKEIRLSSDVWSSETVVLFDATGDIVGLSDVFKVRFFGAHNEVNARASGQCAIHGAESSRLR